MIIGRYLLEGNSFYSQPGNDSTVRRLIGTPDKGPRQGMLFITELIRPKTPASVGGGFQRAVKSSMDSANIQRGLNPPLNEVSFNQWPRAKSFDTFLPLGPYINKDIDASSLNISLSYKIT
ncbi:MAG: hypothetical protein AB1815_07975 [Bacillota bacterium]